ncbi:MAG: class I SAM-dependent methyltransferase [bacterium]|nr:class I SAM-dependent methyltransferase [bacterium]
MSSAFRARLLRAWGSLHIGEVIRRRALRRVVLRFASTGVHVLDAGCGRGDNALWFAQRYPDAAVSAVDIDPVLVEAVRKRAADSELSNVSVQQADIENSSLVTSSFAPPPHRATEGHGKATEDKHPSALPYGIVWSVDVLEHVHDPARAIRQLAAALANDGRLIVHVPRAVQRRWFRRFEHYEQHDHERDGFEPEDLTTLMDAAGLAVETIQHTFGPPGALAWELFHLAQGVGKWLAFLTYPIPWTLAWIDGWFRWKRGNGVLVVARKSGRMTESPRTKFQIPRK